MRKITLTDKHQELLFQIPLFRDLPLNIKHSLLDRLDISLYSVDKKDIIATQGTLCKKLYVLLEGKLRVDIIDGLSKRGFHCGIYSLHSTFDKVGRAVLMCLRSVWETLRIHVHNHRNYFVFLSARER